MKAADIMTKGAVCVAPNASIMQAVGIMLQRRISGLPVVDANGTLVGIVTEGDLLRRVETGTQRHRPRWMEFLIGPGLANEYVHACGRKVHEVMSASVHTIDPDTPLDEIVKVMESRRIKRVPVVRAGRVIGIVSRANLLQALASVSRETRFTTADDSTIRQNLIAELEKQPWAPVANINIIVSKGVVHLWGAIMDERQRPGIRVAAENTPGVKAVRDHLVWVEPNTGVVIPPLEETTAS
jgi:CBS domain-containing protein